LREVDPEQITPLEALNILCQWKKIASAQEEKQPASSVKTKTAAKKEDTFPSLFDL
jgi:hypothetical protein